MIKSMAMPDGILVPMLLLVYEEVVSPARFIGKIMNLWHTQTGLVNQTLIFINVP